MTRPTFLEVKAQLSAEDDGAIAGTAWHYGTPDRVGDVIAKGAFAGAQLPVPMLAHHDPAKPVGVWTELREGDDGLEVKGNLLLADVTLARETKALIGAGAIGGLSIGFITKAATPRKGGGRLIQQLELVEISVVTVPAHPRARIAKAGHSALAIANAISRAALALRAT